MTLRGLRGSKMKSANIVLMFSAISLDFVSVTSTQIKQNTTTSTTATLNTTSTTVTPRTSTTTAAPPMSLPDLDYLLWTPENPKIQQIVTKDKDSVKRSNYDPARPSKVLVHGFGGSPTDEWIINATAEFMIHGDYNIFSVDYETLGKGPLENYPDAICNAHDVGFATGEFIKFLVKEFHAKLVDFHPIGWSLGGQVVGIIGRSLEPKLPRISALDPAGPGFYGDKFDGNKCPNYADEKLSPDDADFVDVIYTSGRWIGTLENVGDANFYPNGGRTHQPGCEAPEGFYLSCSHSRAPVLVSNQV